MRLDESSGLPWRRHSKGQGDKNEVVAGVAGRRPRRIEAKIRQHNKVQLYSAIGDVTTIAKLVGRECADLCRAGSRESRFQEADQFPLLRSFGEKSVNQASKRLGEIFVAEMPTLTFGGSPAAHLLTGSQVLPSEL